MAGLLAWVVLGLVCTVVQAAPHVLSGEEEGMAHPDRTDDRIDHLPGAPEVPFNQYAGYITVNETHGRRLFYWFVESARNPKEDPVLLWLNGGPGCSSLAGFLGELGPFFPQKDGKTLRRNPHAWNRVANVVFLESPSGVGFSYSETRADYTTGDAQTANDAYVFLVEFFRRYPQFADHDFWIAGESYGGHYVPQLAKRIVEGNAEGMNPRIPIKGIQVGNPWTMPALDNEGCVLMWWSHALISDQTFHGMKDSCDFAHIGPLAFDQEKKCDAFIDAAHKEMGPIDIYDIYADVCIPDDMNVGLHLLKCLADAPESHFHRMASYLKDQDPCVNSYIATYLNQADVQEAIHANISYPWSLCSGLVNYSRKDLLTSVLNVYRFLFAIPTPLHILIYSGDVDGIVPVPGTRSWIRALDLEEDEPWRPWMVEKQVGGYVTKYDRLTFATVRQAGHMVPWTQPARAVAMFTRFLEDQTL